MLKFPLRTNVYSTLIIDITYSKGNSLLQTQVLVSLCLVLYNTTYMIEVKSLQLSLLLN